MLDSWKRIEEWLNSNVHEIISTLNPGASKEQIDDLESTLKNTLPSDFKEFMSIHNGQNYTHLKLFDGDSLLSTEDIALEWQTWKEVLPGIEESCIEQFGEPAKSSPDSGIKDDWWNSAWIPITSNGSGDHYCIDLDPAEGGTKGQIIRMLHDDPSRELIASSFHEWIEKYISDLKSGAYISSDDIGWGGVIKPN